MAVIREKRQFQVGQIGVARASEGGRIVGQAISQSADQLADMFYRQSLQTAETAGTEAGQSVEAQKIMTINPQTGKPEAYEAPSSFGRVAAQAYQRVVERRFQQSLDEEMKTKSAEFAVRYENNPNSTSLYESAMSDYIAAMGENAEDRFRTYITDTGTSYLNLTRSNLAINQIRRERTAAQKAQAAAIQDGLNNAEMMIAQIGPSALRGPTAVNGIIESVAVTANDGAEAGLFDTSDIASYSRSGRLAIAKGLVRYASSQAEDPDDLRLLQQAIGTQNPNAVPAQFPEIADALRSFGSDYSGLSDLEKFSDGLLSDAVQYAEVVQSREVAAQTAENAQIVFDMQNSLSGQTIAEQGFALTRGPLAVARRAEQEWNRLTYDARLELVNGRSAISEELIKRRDTVLDAQANGLYAKALSGLGTADTDALENAIVNRNPMLAPESARLELNALLRMEQATGQPVLDKFMSEISSYRSSAGKDVDSIKRAAAAQSALDIDLNSVLLASNPEEAAREVIGQISSIRNLPEPEAKAMIDSAYLNAGRNVLNQFFSNSSLSRDQLREAASALEGGAVQEGVLSEAQISQISRARTYADQAGNLSQLRTTFNSQVSTANARIKASEERQELFQIQSSISTGQASPTVAKNREVFEDVLSNNYANGQDISRIWGNPESLTNPSAFGILNEITRVGILPESLHDTFTSLSEGEFRIGDVNVVLSHYRNFKDYQFEGQVINNPALNSLNEGQRATLDYLSSVADVEGNMSPDRMAALYNQRKEFLGNPLVKERVETILDSSMDDFLFTLDGIDEAPASSFDAMQSGVLSLAALGATRREIKDTLERQIDKTYPDGQGYVVNPNGGSRTRFPLSIAAYGHEDLFKSHVNNIVAQTTGIGTASLNGDRILAQGGRGVGFVRPENTLYLVPLDASDDGEVRYLVKRSRPMEEGGDEMLNGTFAEGETTYSAPIIISNRDPAFVEAVTQDAQRKQSGRDDIVERRQAEEGNPMFGLGGFNIRRFFE